MCNLLSYIHGANPVWCYRRNAQSIHDLWLCSKRFRCAGCLPDYAHPVLLLQMLSVSYLTPQMMFIPTIIILFYLIVFFNGIFANHK
jgi:hypothetical protein